MMRLSSTPTFQAGFRNALRDSFGDVSISNISWFGEEIQQQQDEKIPVEKRVEMK